MRKLMIEAAINELASKEQNPNVPYGPEEVARDAIACAKAGATIVHFHARDADTGEWIETQTLVAPQRMPDAAFGEVVALRGDTALIGAPFFIYLLVRNRSRASML